MPPNILRTKSGRMCHLDAVRDQPLALPGDRERPGLYVLAVLAAVIVAVVMVWACRGGR